MKLLQFIGIIIGSLFVNVAGIHAVEFKTGESTIIGKDQVVSGSLFISGSDVVIDGIVHGDVYCAGRSVIVSGTVDGDILCAGQTLRIEGDVKGNTRLAGQLISFSGMVGKNVNALSQSLTVEQTAIITGELLFGGQTATIAGKTGPVAGVSQTTTLAGIVNGNVLLEAQTVTIDNGAKINGTFLYSSEKESIIPQSASISGNVSYKPIEKTDKQINPMSKAKPWPQNALTPIIFYTLLGLIISTIFPRAIVRIQKNMQESGFVSLVVGLVALIGAPLLFLFFLISIVGIFAIPFIVFMYIAAVSIGRIVVAMLLGRGILEGFSLKSKDNLLFQVLVGVPIAWIMYRAPFIGGFLVLLSVFWSLGGVLLSLRRVKK